MRSVTPEILIKSMTLQHEAQEGAGAGENKEKQNNNNNNKNLDQCLLR